jgi:hypothetical protein
MEIAIKISQLISTAALVATLGVVIWYTVKTSQMAAATRDMARASEKQIEALGEQVSVSQEQVGLGQEQLNNQQRPVLVPVGKPVFQEDHDNWLKWGENEQPLTIRNLGTGTAFNVAGVLYGCAAYLHDLPTGRKLVPNSPNTHWTCWLGVPIAPSEEVHSSFRLGHGSFMHGNDQIGDYPLNAPDEAIPGATALQGVLWKIARVTITYTDIAGRKYASIFDYVHDRGWHMVSMLRDIDRDLHDLEGYYRAGRVSNSSTASETTSTDA